MHRTTISLEFLATYGSEYPVLWDGRTQRQTLHADPHYLCDLASFDYLPEECVALGKQISGMEHTGPLTHELFQELHQKDPEFYIIQGKIGEYMVAVGTLAQDIISEQRVWVGYNAQRIYEERRRRVQKEQWRKTAEAPPKDGVDETDDVPF